MPRNFAGVPKVLLALLVVAMGVACSKEDEKKTSETHPEGYILIHFDEDYGQVSRASDCPFMVDGYVADGKLVLTIYGDYSDALVSLASEVTGEGKKYVLSGQKHVSLPLPWQSGILEVVVLIDGYRFSGCFMN